MTKSPKPTQSTKSRNAEKPKKAALEELEVRDRRAWRRWLERHHATSAGVWLVFYKEHTGVTWLGYEDSVREALCFGWVDSLVKRLDEDRFARKFTPRKPDSAWSASNIQRWTDLRASGDLAPAGLTASPVGAKRAVPPARMVVPELPDDIAKPLKRNGRAWAFFQTLPPGEKRRFVGWIHVAKREETKQRRLKEAIELLARGERLGLR